MEKNKRNKTPANNSLRKFHNISFSRFFMIILKASKDKKPYQKKKQEKPKTTRKYDKANVHKIVWLPDTKILM